MSQDKIFVGSTRVKNAKYGEIINVGFNEKDINLLKENLNERGWVNINLKSKKAGGYYAELEQPMAAGATAGPAANTQDDDLF
jgi:hypothetical protein